MKKTVILFLLLALPLASFAQMVSSSSLVVTRQKLPPVKAGLQHSVELGYADGDQYSNIAASYVIGYRFNNTFFLGGGVGFGYNMGDTSNETYRRPWQTEDFGWEEGEELNIKAIEFPMFVNMKVYFLKARCTPFFGLSAGAAFSAKNTATLEFGDVKYSTIGAIVVPSLGVNYRISAKHSLYVAGKVRMRTIPTAKSSNTTDLTTGTAAKFSYGASIGFTF